MKLYTGRKKNAKIEIYTANEESASMFNMQQVGANIMRCRKAAGMTQMGLADAMGISFQAVSNWERGQSCPDIGRLGELSSLLNVSIDELLGNERAAGIARSLANGDTVPPMTMDEVKELAPIMTPGQVDAAVGNSGELNARDIPDVVPYMSQEGTDNILHAVTGSGCSLEELVPLAPFLRQSQLDELALDCVENGNSLTELIPLAPFLSDSVLDKLALGALNDGCELGEIVSLAPFLRESTLGKLALTAAEDGVELSQLAALAPFLDTHTLDELIRRGIDNGCSLGELIPLAPFVSRSTMDALVIGAVRENGVNMGELAAFAPFISSKAMDELLRIIMGRR